MLLASPRLSVPGSSRGRSSGVGAACGQGETGSDLSRRGDITSTGNFAVCPTSPAHRVRDNGTAAKLAAGVGFRATSSRNSGRHQPRMVGKSPKAEPRQRRRTGAPHVARGVRGLKGQRDSRAPHGQPNHHCQISVGYRVSGAANEGVVHEEGLLAQAHQARYGAGGGALT